MIPAKKIVKEAKKYQSNIYLIRGQDIANAKSLMSILILTIAYDQEIIIGAEGPDEEVAIKKLIRIINNLAKND